MEASDRHHQDGLMQALAALSADVDRLLGFDVLAGGASGASTYRLNFPDGDRILKLAPPESPAHVRERARREIRFYRHLAPEVGIATPSIVASRCDGAAGACLLLRACEPSPVPREWTPAMYIEAAELLGRLHARFWGRADELAAHAWLRRPAGLDAMDLRRAASAWARLTRGGRFEGILTPELVESVPVLLERVRGLNAEPAPMPVTLCHGDFHIDNILMGSRGEMVIADWQEVGPVFGPEDLSFFIQRASFSGGTVPAGAMIDAYRRALVERRGEDVSVRDIRRVMDVAELRTRLLHWPGFLASASARQMRDHLDRIRTLAAGLGIALPADS